MDKKNRGQSRGQRDNSKDDASRNRDDMPESGQKGGEAAQENSDIPGYTDLDRDTGWQHMDDGE